MTIEEKIIALKKDAIENNQWIEDDLYPYFRLEAQEAIDNDDEPEIHALYDEMLYLQR